MNTKTLIRISVFISVSAIIFFYFKDLIISYGDAESHLNIAKRVVSSLTPGLAQLGGIWLPLPHLLMTPFVLYNPLWRSGIAGSIVSSVFFIIICLYLYKTIFLVTKNKYAATLGFLVFALNPNILYLQSTPMTEIPLIAFFTLSSYYFFLYIKDEKNMTSLIVAAFFGLCASLTRYDGWFLVFFESVLIVLKQGIQLIKAEVRKIVIGKFILFSTLAFFGIFLWFLWGYTILGDPLYFTNSQFSARSQQIAWARRGELPAYHNLAIAIEYYSVTSATTSGFLIFAVAAIAFIVLLFDQKIKNRFSLLLVLLIPYIFNVTSLFMGQSVIFIPALTPKSFEWNLFNVRYGVMVFPLIVFLFSYFFSKMNKIGKSIFIGVFLIQICLYIFGVSHPIVIDDGVKGLSMAKKTGAEIWLKKNYDKGLVLIDDYARTVSIIRSGIPMQNIIYIGNKPYWDESLQTPEKYSTWVVLQREDMVWKALYQNEGNRKNLFKYFHKVYTSPDILIFKKT